eukprot:15469406-Alexandrium_andersonii.AAC.1
MSSAVRSAAAMRATMVAPDGRAVELRDEGGRTAKTSPLQVTPVPGSIGGRITFVHRDIPPDVSDVLQRLVYRLAMVLQDKMIVLGGTGRPADEVVRQHARAN